MYEHHLSQGERFELAPVSPVILDAATLGEPPEVTTLSSPPNGFRMPSVRAMSEEQWLNKYYKGNVDLPSFNDDEDEQDDDESILRDAVLTKRRDSLRDHSFRLPSQSSRRECFAEMEALGIPMMEA